MAESQKEHTAEKEFPSQRGARGTHATFHTQSAVMEAPPPPRPDRCSGSGQAMYWTEHWGLHCITFFFLFPLCTIYYIIWYCCCYLWYITRSYKFSSLACNYNFYSRRETTTVFTALCCVHQSLVWYTIPLPLLYLWSYLCSALTCSMLVFSSCSVSDHESNTQKTY